jgi:Fic family protein
MELKNEMNSSNISNPPPPRDTMPIQIFQIAQKLGIQSKVVLEVAKELGIRNAKVPTSPLDPITGAYLQEKVAEWLKAQPDANQYSLKAVGPQTETVKATAPTWKPFAGLPVGWQSLVNPTIVEQVKAWHEQADQMRQRESYNTFLVRMRRQWAIETGVLERLYSISEGATKTLIEQGFDSSLLSHEDTDKPPEQVIAIIRDQHEAIEGLYQFVSGQRAFGTSYVRELHAVLTAHQETYDAVDTLGRSVQPTLIRGEWKTLPNSLGTGSQVEFCPPIHVSSEMEQLVALHLEHEKKGVPPDIQAAWLHHRFTQIHPFSDGNGRVARCLATLVFLKANWFPLVVTRTDRAVYITALRAADAGDLKLLIDLFGSLQAKAIRQAFSLSEETLQGTVALRDVLAAAKTRFKQLREEQEALQKQAISTGDTLQGMTMQRLEEIAAEVSATIKAEGKGFKAKAMGATRSQKEAGYHQVPIVQYAKSQHYYANRETYQAWVLLTINTTQQTELLFSFHGIGRSTGMLACAAMAYDRTRSADGDSLVGDVMALANEPFQFTYSEDPNAVSRRFGRWLEDRILDGLTYWQKNLGR